jgi:hypothetical protein
MAANLFDAAHHCFQRYVVAEPHDHVVFALWALHAHVYQQFEYTPRLALQSPVPHAGKTTVLRVLRALVPDPELLIDPTPATLFRMMGDPHKTFLLDEADNVRIERQLLAILNHGHQKGGTVPRVMQGEVVKWPVFAPVTLAGIGTLPPALISRSIVVHMHRAEPNARITRLDINNESQMRELELIHGEAVAWAAQVNLNTDPKMPAGFKGRKGDKWRVLFAIADSQDRGDIARKAATKFDVSEAHINELLIIDTRKIRDLMKTKGVPSADLVEQLLRLEDCEHDWSEFKGIRPLTPSSLAHVLRAFQINPRSLWWPEDLPRSQQHSCKGYAWADFEMAWRRYAP